MQIETVRFGEVEIDEKKIVRFKEGLPGLEENKRYSVLQFEGSYPIMWFQSLDDAEICLPVIDTFSAMPDYAFNVDDEDVEELGMNGPEDLHVISVLVIPDQIETMTVNLAAPILINLKTGQAKQMILNGGDYQVRFPIFREICRLIKEAEKDAGSVKEDK